MNRKNNKVFCIGWHKTGTTTMGEALLMLGFKIVGARLDLAKPLLNDDLDRVIAEASKFEAFQDMPWAALFRELDTAYPNSKFILTMRDEKAWLHSAGQHFAENHSDMRQWLYGNGVLKGNEDLYLDRYRRHYADVQAYFKDRPQDLLIMSLKDGDGWSKLCPFLEMDVPRKAFPYANKGTHNYNALDWTKEGIRRILPPAIRRKIMDALGIEDKRNRFNNYKENRPGYSGDKHIN